MWPFKEKKQKIVKQVKGVIGLNDELAAFIKYGNGKGETPSSAVELYNQSTAVSVPINRIGEAFAGLDPVLKIGEEIINDSPVLDLLRTPSQYYTKGLFFEQIAKDYLITNETHIVGIGNINRPPIEIQPITPSNVNINENMNGGTPGNMIITGSTLSGTYTPDKRQNKTRYFDGNLKELYYIRGYSTRNNSLLRGQSKLLSASAEVRQHILGGNHNVSLLEKGGRISLVFHLEEDVDQDNLNAARDEINSIYAGADNSGRIAVTAGGKLKVEELSKNNVDMDFANLQKMAKFALAMQYNFPLALITTDAQTFDNYKEAKLAMYDDCVLPLADTIFSGLSRFLLPRFGMDPTKVKITYNMDTITAIKTRRQDELKKLKELDVLSDNELRAEMGREDYENGDIHYKPANLIPAGTGIIKQEGDKL